MNPFVAMMLAGAVPRRIELWLYVGCPRESDFRKARRFWRTLPWNDNMHVRAGQGYDRRCDFFHQLVEAVAILSFRRKGVEILGLRFKSNENSGNPTPCSPR
jgi:hypothetical protein